VLFVVSCGTGDGLMDVIVVSGEVSLRANTASMGGQLFLNQGNGSLLQSSLSAVQTEAVQSSEYV
jgi:hypothetical protein